MISFSLVEQAANDFELVVNRRVARNALRGAFSQHQPAVSQMEPVCTHVSLEAVIRHGRRTQSVFSRQRVKH